MKICICLYCEEDRRIEMYKYLVEMYYIAEDKTEPIRVCDTQEKAQEWIDEEMRLFEYNGTGYYKIVPVRHYQ